MYSGYLILATIPSDCFDFFYLTSTKYGFRGPGSTPYPTFGIFFFFCMNKLLFFSLLEYFMFYFCIEFSTFIRAHSTFRLIKLKKTKFLEIRPF